ALGAPSSNSGGNIRAMRSQFRFGIPQQSVRLVGWTVDDFGVDCFNLNHPGLAVTKVEERRLVTDVVDALPDFVQDQLCQAHAGAEMGAANRGDCIDNLVVRCDQLIVPGNFGDDADIGVIPWTDLIRITEPTPNGDRGSLKARVGKPPLDGCR